MKWLLDPYARTVRLGRWWGDVLYRWYMLRHQLGIPKADPTARYVPPAKVRSGRRA
jgi:hypothetical protein